MLHFKMKAKQSGFTLIELMFVIVIAGVLLAIGVPNLRDFLRNSRLAAESNDLLTGINVARSEAVKRRAPVTMCSGAAPTCDAGDFSDGWFVFVDVDGDAARDGTEDILRRHVAMADGISAKLVETADEEEDTTPDYADGGVAYVQFGQNGFRRMGDGTLPTAMAVVLCDERGNVPTSGGISAGRALELSTAGRAAITRDLDRITALGDCP
jgi:type IV fimbrial biogenesis protein FimT